MAESDIAKHVRATRVHSARELLVNGVITAEEYELLAQLHGFHPPTLGQRIRRVAPWIGYLSLGLAAGVEIAAQLRPELRGPLEQLRDVVNLVVSQ